ADRIKTLKESGPATMRVQLSIESAGSRTHYLVRGFGSCRGALQTLAMFRDVVINRSTVLFVCFTKQNIAEVDDLINQAVKFDGAMPVFSQWRRQRCNAAIDLTDRAEMGRGREWR